MPGRAMLDTNAVIALKADNSVFAHVLPSSARYYVSVITMGELIAGARKSARLRHNLAWLDEFAHRHPMIPCTLETARRYAELKDGLRRAGRPIPENDCWIAASALEWGPPIVTRDAHFEALKGLPPRPLVT